MSFVADNKVLFGAVGIALSSAAVGLYVFRRYRHECSIAKRRKPIAVPDAAMDYIMEYALREPPPLGRLRKASLRHPKFFMLGDPDEAQLIRLLMQLVHAKKVLEVGVYTGFNTLSMAMTLPPDGKVVACDVTDKYLKEIKSEQYFKEAGVESKIDLRIQPALTTLEELIAAGESGSYDLIFIDADKTGYDQYYEKSLQLLRQGGLVVVDNVLFRLRVCSPEIVATDDSVRAIHKLNVKIHKDSRVEMCLLPMADGVNIAMKL